jgi:hypothetical protein
MNNQEIQSFVAQSRAHGVSDAEIRQQLINAGWPQNMVDASFGASAAPHFSSSSSDLGGWAAFEYVLMFISLAFSASGVAGLLHHFVDSKITDPSAATGYYSLSYYSDYLIPFYISISIVTFPIFAFLALRLRSMIMKNPEVRRARIRKLAIYIALSWTFLAMIIRLIETVYGFVKGNALAANALSHLVVTMLISGAIFLYFALEVKKDILE